MVGTIQQLYDQICMYFEAVCFACIGIQENITTNQEPFLLVGDFNARLGDLGNHSNISEILLTRKTKTSLRTKTEKTYGLYALNLILYRSTIVHVQIIH